MLSTTLLLLTTIYSTPGYYDAYFAFNGLKYDKAAILYDCHPAISYDEQEFQAFCKRAQWALGTPVNFCVRTGLQTEERCHDMVRQNTERGDLTEVNALGELIHEGYDVHR